MLKNNKIKTSLILTILIMMLTLILSGCSNSNNKTPEEVLKDNFAGQEFTISFNQEGLDSPLDDLTYTVNNIPSLPTPKKIGYIFEGWFFDKNYVLPYSDDSLKLTMQDVTLYSKWSKERFLNNGTYDIEFESHIVEGTLKLGSTTEEYGGYRDFSDSILYKDCNIEKNDDELLFKLVFDGKVTTPFQSAGQVYNVRINSSMGTDIYIKNKIDSLADSVKTLFIKIDKWDLTKPLLLDVEWTNYEDGRLDETNRYGTLTKYTISINLTNIIGFSEAFVDVNSPLERGYYLAKSYLRQENNTESMAKTYNPVYSYIYSDGNQNYKLIKQNSPYLGLVALDHKLYEPLAENYYERMATFVGLTMVFDVESRGYEGVVESEFYPEKYNAGHYRKTVTEFHADTGKFYNIIDLDPDLSKEYIALTAVSGYMEVNASMGYIRQILSVDYKNLIKISECDYEPVEGDYYEYQDSFSFYPGNYDDVDDKNLTFDTVKKFGQSIEMPNFFYSAAKQNAPRKERTIHSSRIEVTPTKMTNGIDIAESRGVIAEFNVDSKVYGYDVRSGNKLFLDRMSSQTFEGKTYNNQLRDVTQIKTGKDVKPNTNINLEDLFVEKVNPNVSFSNVSYDIFEINNGVINFDKIIKNTGKEFTFSRDVAIEYSYFNGENIAKTIVELKDIQKPTITIQDKYTWTRGENNHYFKNGISRQGETIEYPVVSYKWGETSYKFTDNFYDAYDGSVSINPARVLLFADRGNYYRLFLTTGLSNTFELYEKNMFLMYELVNEFGERDYIYLDYMSDSRRTYEVKDNLGKTIEKADVKFNSEHERQNVYTSYVEKLLYGDIKVSDLRTYTHTENGITRDYTLSYYDVLSNNGTLLRQDVDSDENMVSNINNFLKDKDFGCVTFYYYHYGDWLEINYLYNMTFDGLDTFKALDFENYFTNTNYSFIKTSLIGGMKKLDTVSISIKKYVDGRPSKNPFDQNDYGIDYSGSQFQIHFNVPGTYMLEFNYSIKNTLLDNPSYSKDLKFRQMIEVDSNYTDIEITYITDDLHPFNDGELTRTVKYNLGEGIKTMLFTKDDFDPIRFGDESNDRTKDILSTWGESTNPNDVTYKPGKYISGEQFIKDYNSKHIYLYAIWEIKIRIECTIRDDLPKEYVTANYSDYEAKYVVKFPNIRKALIPKGMVFAGWTGGFLGGSIYKDQTATIPYKDDYYKPEYSDMFKVKAVFKYEYNVVYSVNRNYADAPASEKVIDGERIKNPADKMYLSMNNNNYTLVGYYVKDSGNQNIVDLSKYIITKDTIFVAVFRDKQGNLVS